MPEGILLPAWPVRCLGAALLVVGLVFPFAVIAVRAMRWEPPAVIAPVMLRPELVILLGGTFQMGSPDDEPGHDDDEALHEVTISPFVIARTEVTQEQFGAVFGASPVGDGCEEAGIGDDLPVVCVSWLDAVRYCNALSVAEELTPVYTIDGDSATWDRGNNGYRLPTEAEWEFAARAGTRTRWVGTDVESEACGFGNVGDRSATTHSSWESAWESFECDDGFASLAPVMPREPPDKRQPNAWYLFGFGGNAAEWVWDPYQPDRTQLEPVDPVADSGGDRVIRGGSVWSEPRNARVAFRYWFVPSDRYGNLGFRVARSVLRSEVLPSDPLP